MDTTLVVLAAGIGSRFGGGIKQLEPVGPNGEIIMDYSIYDALEAGFNKVVFIIRKDLEKDFKEIIGNRIEKVCKVEYVFQEKDAVPEAYLSKAAFRQKPWGTGQAIMLCKDAVKEPFAVINADDYYGKTAFRSIHDYLVGAKMEKPYDLAMIGFILGNTLSDNGSVTRGVCSINADSKLVKVTETGGIVKTATGAGVMDKDGEVAPIDENAVVSMNLWGLTPNVFDEFEKKFDEFLAPLPEGVTKDEYCLPTIIDELLQEGKATVNVLYSQDKWFGVTYKEDKQVVVDSFKALIDSGVYPEKLF